MAEIKEKKTFINPYVVQMDKFADSLIHLSKTFLTLEEYKGTFSKEEIEEMFLKVRIRCVKTVRRRSGVLVRTVSIHIRCSMRSSVRWRNLAPS